MKKKVRLRFFFFCENISLFFFFRIWYKVVVERWYFELIFVGVFLFIKNFVVIRSKILGNEELIMSREEKRKYFVYMGCIIFVMFFYIIIYMIIL